MKKIERLRLVEENFGPEFVLKYFYCTTWIEIENANLKMQNKFYSDI